MRNENGINLNDIDAAESINIRSMTTQEQINHCAREMVSVAHECGRLDGYMQGWTEAGVYYQQQIDAIRRESYGLNDALQDAGWTVCDYDDPFDCAPPDDWNNFFGGSGCDDNFGGGSMF